MVVFDEEIESQDSELIIALGEALSQDILVPVFAVLNHDDDVLCYWLFDSGRVTDFYISDPAYFSDNEAEDEQGGDSLRLCTALGVLSAQAEVEACLREALDFAGERHEKLAQLLGLPSWSVGFGYSYVIDGELEQTVSMSELIRTN